MPKKVIHYRDRKTGLYVTKAKWQRARARGSKRYVRSKEKYTKPVGHRLPRPVGPIAPGGPDGRIVERLKYQGESRRFDLEIVTDAERITSVRVNGRKYTQRSDFRKLADLVDAARIEGVKVKPKKTAR